jgi:hypothetical protein
LAEQFVLAAAEQKVVLQFLLHLMKLLQREVCLFSRLEELGG